MGLRLARDDRDDGEPRVDAFFGAFVPFESRRRARSGTFSDGRVAVDLSVGEDRLVAVGVRRARDGEMGDVSFFRRARSGTFSDGRVADNAMGERMSLRYSA